MKKTNHLNFCDLSTELKVAELTERARLTFTRIVAELWLYISDEKQKKDLEDLIIETAKEEWGFETNVFFGLNFIEVENSGKRAEIRLENENTVLKFTA